MDTEKDKTIICPRCGNRNLFSDEKCSNCGLPLARIREILSQESPPIKHLPNTGQDKKHAQRIPLGVIFGILIVVVIGLLICWATTGNSIFLFVNRSNPESVARAVAHAFLTKNYSRFTQFCPNKYFDENDWESGKFICDSWICGSQDEAIAGNFKNIWLREPINNYDITSVDVRIEQIFTTNGEASITFTYEGQEYLLSFVLVKYSGGWYISDSIYDRFQIALRNK